MFYMPKKKKKIPKRDVKYHIRHKSRLISLLIVKILLVFLVSLLALGGVYALLKNVLNIIFVFIISFVVASVVYLFLIIKVLKLFRF